MVKRVVEWFRHRTGGRTLKAFQVEVTSRCNLRCVMCPRVGLADRWREMDLPWEAFQRIARAFDRVKHVHLQGWGEPLLHPRLFDMIAVAKDAGCRVGFTTNGMRLTPDAARRLVDLRLDLLAVSIAGATPRTHESLRVGSDLPLILENIRRLLALRSDHGRDAPKVELSYLMTRTNMEELPQAVELAASLGADELYATNLDYVVTPEQDALKAFNCPPPLCEAFSQSVELAGRRAERAGLAFRSYPLEPDEAAMCEADPLDILFVSCDGWVSPCTYMGLAGQSEIPRYFGGRSLSVPRVRFGNIKDRDLMAIWSSPAYQQFRQQFAARLSEARTRALGLSALSGDASEPGTAPPEPCRTCYKLYGL